MRSRFDRDLKLLDDDFIEMGLFVERGLHHVSNVLTRCDIVSYGVIKSCEHQVHELEHRMQSSALRLIYAQQPVAKDLYSVTGALNLLSDMERISDQCCDIAEIALLYQDKKMQSDIQEVIHMLEQCASMVKNSIDAYVSKDVSLANKVIASDDIVDQYFIEIRDTLILLIQSDTLYAEESLDLFMIIKYLERIGDHAVNIAQWVIYSMTGVHKYRK